MALVQPTRASPCSLLPCPWGPMCCPLQSPQAVTPSTPPVIRGQQAESVHISQCAMLILTQRKCVMLQSLDLSQSTLQGSLPSDWGQPQAFPSLMIMNTSFTQLTGPLPSAWGSPDAFLKLMNLSMVHTDITGGLPVSWATPGAWPQLVALQVDQTHISGH